MAAHVGLLLIAVVLIAGVLWDTFETIILPRRVTGRFRLPRLFYRTTWVPWSALARRVPAGKRRESSSASLDRSRYCCSLGPGP